MNQLKYPNKSITKPQIKKIHTLISILNMPDDHYRALLMRFNVESSTELNRSDAVDVIEILTSFEKSTAPGQVNKKANGIANIRKVFFDRNSKATDNQLIYIMGLWIKLSTEQTYSSLVWFIKKVVGKLYLHIESLVVNEASSVIVILEKWNKQKEINL